MKPDYGRAEDVSNLNRVVLIGGLARDPELRRTPGGVAVATLRLAFSTQRKVNGSWRRKPNYIDVEVWGGLAESTTKHLSKGRQVAADGRLEWRDPSNGKGGLDTHKLVADRIEFLPPVRARREPARGGQAGRKRARGARGG